MGRWNVYNMRESCGLSWTLKVRDKCMVWFTRMMGMIMLAMIIVSATIIIITIVIKLMITTITQTIYWPR